jgi:hypothetical protein
VQAALSHGEQPEGVAHSWHKTLPTAFVMPVLQPSDIVTVDGVKADGTKSQRDETDKETVEHEVVGHVRDAMNGVQPNEANAIKAENECRKKSGIDFIRTKYEGKVSPRGQP